MTSTAQVPVSAVIPVTPVTPAAVPAPTLEQEMRGSLLLFAMFGLAFMLLGAVLGTGALLEALVS